MHRPPIFVHALGLAIGLVALSTTATAHAQITYTFLTYGDRDTPTSGATNYLVNWPISYEECEADEPISMVLTNAPYDGTGMTRLVWDLWQGGTGTAGADCQTATNRRTVAGGTAAVCTNRSAWSGGGQITSTMPTITFRPQELFPDGCESTAQGTYVFYVLAVSAAGDMTTDIAATSYFAFSVALDFEAPDAPVVEDAAGDRQIVLTWSNETTETLSSARVYVDTSVECGGSTSLVAGSPPPATLAIAAEVSGSAPTTATLDGVGLGLEIGQSAPFAVTVRDLARNESVLSNVGCLERVPVEGFWDAYCREQMLSTEECRQRYSGCTAAPGSGTRPRLAWLVGLALLVTVARRRVAKRVEGAR